MKLKRAGKKVIFDSHEKYTEQIAAKPYLPRWLAHLISGCYGAYEHQVLRKLDAVIFPCTMDGKNPFAGQCKRTPLISNAAILGEFFDFYDPNAPKMDRQVCYVGGLTRERGITAAVQAAHRAKATLVLAGSFSPQSYGDELQVLPEYASVCYRGLLDRTGVRDLLAQSRVGLCTLLDVGQYLKIDTFGIKVYEYMSMALPVILSHSAYNDRMIEKYRFGICVDPEQVDELSNAIRYLLDHPDEARQMGENGRRAVEQQFNWGVEEKKLLALYNDILNDK